MFAIHFGYNYFLLGRAWKRNGLVYRAAAGPILTNPENTIRGRKFRERPGILTKHLFLVGEAAFTAGFAWSVPVVDGSANVPNFAVHGHLGVGVGF